MLRFLKLSIIICTFLGVKVSFAEPSSQLGQVDVLFCLYDMGDSNPMKRLVHEFEKQGITYKILPFGKAQEIFADASHLIKFDFADAQWGREKILETKYLDLIKSSIKSKIVIAGMASAIQAQILNLFKKEGVYTIAFYDNFDSIENKEYVQAFLKQVNRIDEYFLPSQTTLLGFQNLDKTKHSKLNILGQPSLEDWDDIFSKADKNSLKRSLGLLSSDQVILFVGGYDDTYEEYFRLFVKAMKAFKDNPHIKVLVTYHPKTDGSLEKSVIKEEKADNIKVIEKGSLSTAEVATITNVLCCHKSSVGIQALYVGLPVIYVVKKGELDNFAIKQGFAPETEDISELLKAIERILSTANRNQPPIKDIGFPKDATKKMARRIKELLNSNTNNPQAPIGLLEGAGRRGKDKRL